MFSLGDGFISIKPLLSSTFGSELSTLLTNPLTALEGNFSSKLGAGITNSLSGIAQKFGVAAESADAFGASVVAAAPPIAALAATAGITADIVKHMADAFENAALPVLQFQRISGATADESSRFVAVLSEFGIATQAAGTAILRMDNNFQQHQKTLQELGVQTADVNGKTLQGIPAFEALAQAFSHTSDQATRTNLIVQAFGTRIGAQLLPLLVQGKQGLAELFAAVPSGLIFDQKQLQQAQDFKVATAQLGQAFKGLEVEVGSALVPELIHLADGLVTIVKGLDDAGKSIEHFASQIPGASTALRVLVAVTNPVIAVLDLLGRSHHNTAAAAQAQADAENNLTKAITQGEKDLESNISAQNTYADALTAVVDDQTKIADLTTQVNALQLDSAETTQLFASNMRALDQANISVRQSTESVAQAYKTLNDILHPSAENVGKASLAVAEAQNNLAQANQSVLDQERKIKDLQAVSVNSPDLVNANLQLAQSKLGVTAANFALQDAEQQLHDIQNPTSTDAFTQAQLNLQSAIDAQAAAVQRAADAKKVVDDEQKTRLDELKTKTGDLQTAEGKLARDRQTIGLDAIKAFNAQTALANDLTTSTNTALTAEITLIEKLYPAAKASLDQILGLISGGTLNSPGTPGPLGDALQRGAGGLGLLGGLAAGNAGQSGTGTTGTTVPGSQTTTGTTTPGVVVNVHPATGQSEAQVGAAAASAISWHTQRARFS